MLQKGVGIGNYTLVEKLGSGGFGDVWKAEKRTALDVNYFALKFFRPDEGGIDFEKISRELAVWKLLRGLPYIISMVELDRFGDYVYVVSDYAEGGSLESWIRKNDGKAPSVGVAVKIAAEILAGLENLHEKNFVHRDLKPDNVLIMNGKHCLADFGISREIKAHSRATGTAGTMEYMPPEAFEKTPSVTPATDVWAVGAILQRLLTGSLPFPQTDLPALICAILMTEPAELPGDTPETLKRTIRRALMKRPEERFASAFEMRAALLNLPALGPELDRRTTSTSAGSDLEATIWVPEPSGRNEETVSIPKPSVESLPTIAIHNPPAESVPTISIPKPSVESQPTVAIPKAEAESVRTQWVPAPTQAAVEDGEVSALRAIGTAPISSSLNQTGGNPEASYPLITTPPDDAVKGKNFWAWMVLFLVAAVLVGGLIFIKQPSGTTATRVNVGAENGIPMRATRQSSEGGGIEQSTQPTTSTDDKDFEKVAVKTATPTPKPIPKIISGGVMNGKATNLVKPPYPASARAVRASGPVNVQVTIDENGNVISASAVSGHPLLRAAAASAARSSKFSPTILSGQPVKVTGVIVYNFQP